MTLALVAAVLLARLTALLLLAVLLTRLTALLLLAILLARLTALLLLAILLARLAVLLLLAILAALLLAAGAALAAFDATLAAQAALVGRATLAAHAAAGIAIAAGAALAALAAFDAAGALILLAVLASLTATLLPATLLPATLLTETGLTALILLTVLAALIVLLCHFEVPLIGRLTLAGKRRATAPRSRDDWAVEAIRLVFQPERNGAVPCSNGADCPSPPPTLGSRHENPGMTYCLGMRLDAGLILMADTRTNAGVDNFSSFKKLHTLADEPDRQIFACTAGSLSMSQSVIGLIQEGLPASEGSEMARSLRHATTMFRAAQLIGEAVQIANQTVGKALQAIKIESWVSLLLGGRIGDGPPMLFQIYNAGNFIECTPEVPFMQIGETKYGKPILDRGLSYDTPLHEAVKFGFLSFDSAMRSNLGVARPLDLMAMPRDRTQPLLTRRIEEKDPYFDDLSERWARYLHQATENIPNPPWMPAG